MLRKFSHNDKFTDYMQIIYEMLKSNLKSKSKILDIPAGYGLLGDELQGLGHIVIYADINDERSDYVQANMEFPLPFADNEFDAVICMEGIEHVINQNQLLNELVRVTKKGGFICISTPNVSNFWSRLTFLFTGHFYGFMPHLVRIVNPTALVDKGHISPISLYELGYIMAVSGASLLTATGDRFKKKIFLPLALLIFPFSYYSTFFITKQLPIEMFATTRNQSSYFNIRVFLSRSLVAFFVKH